MNREIKFRQPIYIGKKIVKWHYWGWFGDGEFRGPLSNMDAKGEKGQQFTGLVDRDGIEIYEGDILSAPLNDLCVIEWDTDEYRFGVIDEPYWYFDDQCKVIGNIYENPELVK